MSWTMDDYDHYEDQFDPMTYDRQARRSRKPKARHVPKVDEQEVLETLVDEMEGLEGGFEITYKPSIYEAEYLLDALRGFFDQSFITDVLALVKGGKEASVYACEAHPSTGKTIIAAKVYRPRKFRNLRNDAMYREGRTVMDGDGVDVTEHDRRSFRAIQNNTAFGKQVRHVSWLMHEYSTLQTLHVAGAAVPEPIAAGDNAILMGFVGDDYAAAPTLSEIKLEAGEAEGLFQEVLRNIDLLLSLGWVHGDLSAYNILYFEGKVTLIDFPQVTHSENNSHAHAILVRDIARVCEYFAKYGIEADPAHITRELWRKHVGATFAERRAEELRLQQDGD